MQFKIDDVIVEIIEPKKISSPKEDAKMAAAFIFKIAEMNYRQNQIYKTS